MMDREERLRRIKAYRAGYQCSLQEAIRAVDRAELVADINRLTSIDDMHDILLRMMELIK